MYEETAGRECGERLQVAINAVKPTGRMNSCKKKKKERERGKKEKTSDGRAILRKFWQNFEEFLSPHQL